MTREAMSFDVLIVGAGPAGLASAIRLQQLARAQNTSLAIAVIEKGSEVGAHILSGAVFDPKALNELLPDWPTLGAPLTTPVSQDHLYFLSDAHKGRRVPNWLVPPSLHNPGHYVISLGNLCRWLAQQAEALDINIFPGFPAREVLFDDAGAVKGVCTNDMGRAADGSQKSGFTEGMELLARFTVFAEGCRGHLGKQLIQHFDLAKGRDPQHYALGIKELWEIDPGQHQPGLVVHGAGWPLTKVGGGWFLYHLADNQVAVGLVVDLNYDNPYLHPYEEFQRLKHHPIIRQHLDHGKRVAYGARALVKGGFNALPKMHFPGGVLIGCDAGTLNAARIKGSHTAMKSGMIAAEAIMAVWQDAEQNDCAVAFERHFQASWLRDQLYRERNFVPALHRFGPWLGGAWNWLEQTLFKGALAITLHDTVPDHKALTPAAQHQPIDYDKPDGVLSFDRLSSVFLSNTNHAEDQPCHLQLKDDNISIDHNLPVYDEPAQRYCPAGVYELVAQEDNRMTLRINSQNCVHCKTCDIKDPLQNIQWITPEGGGGPNYTAM